MVTLATEHKVRNDTTLVRLEEVHGALLLHGGIGQATALRAVTGALADAHPETIVVTSPAVSGRADVFDLAAEALDRTPPARPAVRLVLLGDGPDRAARIAGVGQLAERLGRRVTGSLGRVTVASDGTCVSVAEPDDLADGPIGWHSRTGTGDGRDEAPWSPVPAWPGHPAPRPRLGPGVVARAVPAGWWLLPAGVDAGQTGVAASLPREPDAPTLFVGGCGRPVEADDLMAAVIALHPDPATRLVLLPGALPVGTGLARLADLPVRLRCAVPARTRAGRRLAPVTPEGVVLPIGVITPPPEPVTARPEEPDDAPPVPGPRTAARGPQTAPAVAGRPTPAGWSFLPGGSPPFGFVAAIDATVIEVACGRRGFIVDGAPVRAGKLADLLLAAGITARAPLVVVDPSTSVSSSLVADLATAWGATVYAPSGPAGLTVTGALLASGGFTAYLPGAAAHPAGPVLPAACAGALASLATRMMPPTTGEQRAPRRRAGQRINGHQPGGVVVPAPEDPVTKRVRPRIGEALPAWDLAGTRGPDHARIAEDLAIGQPDTGEGGESADADRSLIALRAWVADPTAVNVHLRSVYGDQNARDGQRGAAPAALAAAATLALRRMPLVFGPVYATSDGPDGGYAPGMELVEPGFVTARLSLAPAAAGRLTYVIWSTSGRHLTADLHGDGAVCVFVPNSRFRVLGEDSGTGRSTVVYLADQAADRPFDVENLLARLRAIGSDGAGASGRSTDPRPASARDAEAPAGTVEDRPPPRPAGPLIGLADGGRPYPLTTPV
ncbi:hypothetical protein C1I95_20810 [Micromonospora craterilacus]|uniref:Uncharacterized protein n=1 Tax=Micromonospora craterilacus TaxID=1655439 RepID=A0A2W2DSF5_9ACTN|nr:hypothetical protein [Micromonospora craterilacus]PZG14876.1 hypothetical protein C1I95_20810 [Micromonospora craterilacus]